MCAINGFNFKNDDLIMKMNQVTAHRGPDHTDSYSNPYISLGHNRLSIIDTSASSNQPMQSYDKNLIITFNGEIYNFQELKTELKKKYPFTTNSDTEVIIAAHHIWGPECIKKFNGIFAYALWNNTTQELLIARDPVGVKPLYYYHEKNVFIFSSEIKAILQHDIPRRLNTEAFNHYLKILYTPQPHTMFQNIYKFPPRQYAILKNNILTFIRYNNEPQVNTTKKSLQENARDLREKIDQSVQRQLVSDRPVGVYLSGGIDSSCVLNSMAKSHTNINTFSVGFDLTQREEPEKFNIDYVLAEKTAKHYHTTHHPLLVSSEDVIHNIEKTIWHSDEPISHPTAVPMMLLAQHAKKYVAVTLGGDGGDELFGGYERYRLSYAQSIYQKQIPNFIREKLNRYQKLKKLNTPSEIGRYALFWFSKSPFQKLINTSCYNAHITVDFFQKNFFNDLQQTHLTFEEKLMLIEQKSWLVDYSLTLTDKMTMSAGLEERVPLLDKELIDFSLTIPLEQKISLFKKKILLKEAFKNDLPAFLFHRPKRGWIAPGAKWLRHKKFIELTHEVLSPSYYAETNHLFHWNEIESVVKNHINRKEYNLSLIWSLLTFQMWAKMYNVRIS